MFLLSAIVGLFALAAPVLAVGEAPREITTCVDERPWLPFTNPDPREPGTMQQVVALAAKRFPVRLVTKALPWRRCLEDVRSGRIDAAIGAAYVPSIAELAAFPLVNSKIDPTRRLGTARVVVAKRQGSVADWDGHRFLNLTKPVGTTAGTQAISNEVTLRGGAFDDGAQTDERNLIKLVEGKVDLIAAYDCDLRPFLAGAYHGKIASLKTPLLETAYYLAFSRPFATKNKAFTERFWSELRDLRGDVHAECPTLGPS